MLLMIFIFVFIFFQSILCITRFPRFEDLQLYRQGWPNQRIQVQCIQITQKGKKFYDSSNDVLNDFCWNSLPHSLTNSPYLWFLTSPPPPPFLCPSLLFPFFLLSFYFLFQYFLVHSNPPIPPIAAPSYPPSLFPPFSISFPSGFHLAPKLLFSSSFEGYHKNW